MTQREKLLALLDEFGIKPLESGEPGEESFVILKADHGGVEGYSGFITSFDFWDDGSFRSVGVWE